MKTYKCRNCGAEMRSSDVRYQCPKCGYKYIIDPESGIIIEPKSQQGDNPDVRIVQIGRGGKIEDMPIQ